MEGAAPSRREGVNLRRSRSFSGLLGGYPRISQGPRSILGEAEDEEGEDSKAERLAHFNQPLVSQAEPNFLKIMEKMTQFMGTQAHKLRGFIQSCQLIFHNDPENLFSDRKKVLYSTFFLTGRAGKWIEPYLSNISNEDPSYLLNNWQLFETQLFTLFGDPNEVRKPEQELDSMRMKESGHACIDSPKGEDLILGHDFLYHFNPINNWRNALITYDSNGIRSSTSNELATAVKSVALVGELKTPSLPSSVHIPSIMPSQLLLLSRDEVFEGMKDVGEYAAICLLHLFQGDMDLPPLTFHAFLEEQWDEEEETE
ncbi:hypothetical protein O181_039381 [Austropuccinia psidii MF-1]|uniref:DUF4939 domain-containing protein n=1 Tax=Austropuccinia psidii MF-1 TaxID=1389203 RepID=A0A9Q3D9L7_9BASI|nr:hypothetical protein [Austropuccinia psidii MF-1]